MKMLPLRKTLGKKPEALNIREQHHSTFTVYAASTLKVLASIIPLSELHFCFSVAVYSPLTSILTLFFSPNLCFALSWLVPSSLAPLVCLSLILPLFPAIPPHPLCSLSPLCSPPFFTFMNRHLPLGILHC